MISLNHNETIASEEVELVDVELDEIIAPIRIVGSNHNETLVSEELNIEELEEAVATHYQL